MRISENGIALIKHFEGLRLMPYRDSVGILTCGYGHVGPSVSEGHAWSAQEADDELELDLAETERLLNDLGLHLTQSQFDALASLVFNIGGRAFVRSTLLKLLRSGALSAAADEFAKWNKAGGKVVDGLVRRRRAERDMFLGRGPLGTTVAAVPSVD